MSVPFQVSANPSSGPLDFKFDSGVGPVGPAGATGAVGSTGPGCITDPVLDNLFCGDSAGDMNTTGGHNTFLGDHSGPVNTTASFNTFLGADSGLSASGTSNTFLGYSSGAANGGGTSNTFVGAGAGATTKAADNILIGADAEARGATASNELVLGSVAHPILEMEIGPNLDVILPIVSNPSINKELGLFSVTLGLGESISMKIVVGVEGGSA